MKSMNALLSAVALTASISASQDAVAKAGETPPNFIVIVLDDLGYTDLGAFGGEISTPNLDRLVQRGVRFSNFYTSATCSPTRAMLMTGADNHVVGLGTMAEAIKPGQEVQPGYEGFLNDRLPTVAQLLASNGYHTMMVGKWHLGREEGTSPAARGFARSYSLTQGAANHHDDTGIMSADPKALYREDGKLVSIPAKFYSTDFFTTKMTGYLDEARSLDKPFFAYLAYSAPHWPLQAPREAIDKYQKRYEAGYDVIREARRARARRLGTVPAGASDENYPGKHSWSSLTPDEKTLEARRMATYAAMVEHVDTAIGRLIEHLRRKGQLQNTYIFVMSDNGAAGENLAGTEVSKWWESLGYDNSLANIGARNSFAYIGPNWAHVATAPFRNYKGVLTEGGIRAPAFLYHSSGKSTVSTRVTHVMDVAPTLLDLAGLRDLVSKCTKWCMEGRSFASVADGAPNRTSVNRASEAGRDIGWELFGNRALRDDRWKIVMTAGGPWQLFDLAADPGETRDLAASKTEKLRDMVARWDAYAARNGVQTRPPK